jgi:uncharacterized repeat protein (TIGR01451 family)
MFRHHTSLPVKRTGRGPKKQKGIAQRKRPDLTVLIIVPLTLVALLGSLLGQATPAYAVSGSHDSDLQAEYLVSFDAKSGSIGTDAGSGFAIPYQQVTPLEVEIISSPYATLDSNDPTGASGEVPNVFVVQAVVTNTGTVAASDVVVTLEYDDPVDGWILLAGENPVRTIDELAPGAAYHAYWFARYPTTYPTSHEYTVTAALAGSIGDPVSASATVQTRGTVSSANQYLTYATADITVGVAFTATVGFYLGQSTDGPDDIVFSPVGNPDFDPGAYRLMGSSVRFYNDAGTWEQTIDDLLYFSTLPSSAENAEVNYTFLALTPQNTRLCPYAGIRFGSNTKYDQRYCSEGQGTSGPTIVPIEGTVSLDLTKQVNSQTVQQGRVLTYTIDYANNGDTALLHTWIWDEVPEGVSIIASSISPDSDPDETTEDRVAWNLGTVPAAGTGSLTFEVLVDGEGQDLSDGTPLVNNAFFGINPGSLPQRAALTSTVTTNVRAPTISLTKSDGQTTVAPDGLLTYNINIDNSGSRPATGAVLTDVLPSDVTLVGPVTPPPDSSDGQTLVWNNLPIPAGESLDFSIPVRVDPDAADGTTLTNSATVTYRNAADHDYAPETASDTTTVEIPPTELALTKTAEDLNGEPLAVGDAILYTLQVTNTGVFTAYNVSVFDDLPDQVTCQEVSGDNAPTDCDDPLVWNMPSLGPGATASLYIRVTIKNDAEGETIVNTGSVTGDNVPDPPEDPSVCPNGSTPVDGECPSTPGPSTTLALGKTAEDVDGPPVVVGDTIRYTLQVTNTGIFTAYNVVVTDDLPEEVTCQDVSGDHAPSGCADPLVWSIPSLAPGATAWLYVEVTINRGSEGKSITNTASVIGGNVPDPPDDPTPVCPDGSLPVDGVCEATPEPAPGSAVFLPIIKKYFK